VDQNVGVHAMVSKELFRTVEAGREPSGLFY